jgi:acyl phosphate:glycerol-3-phosphate acyltransferase
MIIILCTAAYFLGAIPTGYIVTRLVKGIDIRSIGSGNPGATNVYRTAGAAAGIVTFIVDVIKGFLPVMLAVVYFDGRPPYLWIIVGLFAIFGHIWTIFLGFKGGKGVATACGVFLALMPLPTLYAFILFSLILILTRYVSAGSIGAALSLPVFAWLTGEPKTLSVFAAVIGIIVIIKHKKNIERLINGTENKLGKKAHE